MVMSVVAARAHAQFGDSSAIAEQLFNQARDLAKANQWPEACSKFEASLRYDPVLGTRLNLATCYEHIGKLASAWGLYRESIDLAKKAGDVKRRNYAQTQVAALEPRLPKLIISAPAKPPAGFVVRRDGTSIDAGALGVALYVDPGAHEITASAPGFEAFTQTVTLGEAKAEVLAIPNMKAVPMPGPSRLPVEDDIASTKPLAGPPPTRKGAATTEPVVTLSTHKPTTTTEPTPRSSLTRKPTTTTEPMVERSLARKTIVPTQPVATPWTPHKTITTTETVATPSSTRKYVAIGVGAAGMAAAGVGFLFGAKANSKYSDTKALCGASLVCDPADYGKGKQLMYDAHKNATISTVLVAAGGAAIVGSAIMFLTAPHARERTTARLVPVVHDRDTGFAITGRF